VILAFSAGFATAIVLGVVIVLVLHGTGTIGIDFYDDEGLK
jgi:hypothetical protein